MSAMEEPHTEGHWPLQPHGQPMGSKAAGVEFVTQAKVCMHAHRA